MCAGRGYGIGATRARSTKLSTVRRPAPLGCWRPVGVETRDEAWYGGDEARKEVWQGPHNSPVGMGQPWDAGSGPVTG